MSLLRNSGEGPLPHARDSTPNAESLRGPIALSFGRIPLPLDPHWIVLLILPFLLLLTFSNWMFGAALPIEGPPTRFSLLGKIDPWIYYGYFRNFAHFEADLFPGTYYGSRLSWLLPGFLAHRFLPPLAANYGLHLTFYYLAIFPFYWLLKYAAGARTALLASLLLGCYPYFLKAAGSDYVDGASIAYYFLTVAFLTHAARSHSLLWPILAGLTYAALFYTNVFSVIFSPFLLGYYIAARKYEGCPVWTRALAHTLFGGALGFAALSIAFGAISYLVTGNFWFYAPSIAFVVDDLAKATANPWKKELPQWLPAAGWLVVPALTALVSTLFLLRWRREGSSISAAYSALFVGSFAAMAFLEIKGKPVLELDYYASYLIAPAFLAIASQFGSELDRMKRASFWLMTATVTAAGLLVPWGRTFVTGREAALAALVFGGVWMLAAGARRNLSGTLLVVAAIAGEYYPLSAQDPVFARGHAGKNAFIRVTESAEFVKTAAGNRNVRLWYSQNERDPSDFYWLNSIYLWDYTRIGMDFPWLAPDARLGPSDVIVIPSAEQNALDRAQEILRDRRFKGTPLSRHEIRNGGLRYFVTLIAVELDTDRLQTLTVPESKQGPQRLIPAAAPTAALPLDRWELSYYPNSAGWMKLEPDGLNVTTERLRWAYGTMYTPLVAPFAGEYRFVLKYRLLSGRMIFGALTGDRSRWLAQAVTSHLDGDRRLQTLSLRLESGQQIWLLTSNDHPAGDVSSRYVVEEVRAFFAPAQ